MARPTGENHPYNRLQKQFSDKADECRELQKELAETRSTAVLESQLRDRDQEQIQDLRRRLSDQVSEAMGYKRGVEDMTRLLLRCNDKRVIEGLSALFG